MALNGNTLGAAIAAAIIAAQTGLSGAEQTILIAKWQIIAGEIVSHITGSAVVNTTVTGVTATGTPGGPLPITAQPGIGTVS